MKIRNKCWEIPVIATLPPITTKNPVKSIKKDPNFQTLDIQLPPDEKLPLRQFASVSGDITMNGYKLGNGARGRVKVLQCVVSKQFFAVKIFDLENYGQIKTDDDEGPDSKAVIDTALSEFRIRKILDPHNVHWFERKTDSLHKLYLIEPLMVGPELLSVLPSITPDQKPAYAIALVEAVAQFHHAGFAHCNLKLQNVIVLRVSGDDGCSSGLPVRMRLIDFFMAQPLTHTELGIGPESTDIFSLGIILYEIFTGRQGTAESVRHENQPIQIFDGKTEMANLGWLPSDDIDPAIQAMINAMVSFLPSSRPTLDKVSAALSGASAPDR